MMPTILCVDDDPLVLEVTCTVLERHGYRVLTAAAGGAALSLVRQTQEEISVVLLDWRLPDMTGEDLVLRLKQARPGVKLLVTSGDGTTAALPPEVGGQVAGFLAKPYFPSQLIQAVRRALGQARRTAAA
jgi:CheY-like chemotaxis protein